MNLKRFALMGAALACLGGSALLASPAAAQAPYNMGYVRDPNTRTFGYVNKIPGSAQSFSTTSYAALTGLTVNNFTMKDPSAAPSYGLSTYEPDALLIWWDADVSKVTSTGGTCAVYLNGTIITATARTFTPAAWTAEGHIGGFYHATYANGDQFNVGTSGETQTVALYCKSGDTAAFTVNNATLYVQERY